MSKFRGIAVYEILPNGCLNGVYSNDDPATEDEIFNEIARKHPNEVGQGIEGKYTCGYIDLKNPAGSSVPLEPCLWSASR